MPAADPSSLQCYDLILMLKRLSLSILLLAGPLAAQIGNATWATAVPRNFQEPAWWDQGVVFVGNWEPLVFRLRHGGEIPVDMV